ncbi:Heparinase II/III-like protein [Candidatus Rhodobacter oscarellae]|uniref:Heparinase II/III-like protein n=1 Tax=Candidatus Rhodobacter oscarellae TaxID=1675527 RepID=A0A0J9H3E7_9RHOB|nr:Heparinase II/III-like protein [Candidatus Rhodobacter lobularis]
MYQSDWTPGAVTRLLNRWHARRAAFARAAAGFVSQPEPRTIGRVSRGRQLCAGNFMFAGHMIEAPGKSIWDLDPPDQAFLEELHGFTWLDDLAATGDAKARMNAQAWTEEWIARYGHGRGPGWMPDSAGRRLIRWINHAIFLLNAQDRQDAEAYYRSLGQQTIFLSRRWSATPSGVPRFEALTGLIYAGLALIGMEQHVAPATAALSKECEHQIDALGGISSRNPEALLEVFTLLNWATSALSEAGQIPPKSILSAIERIAPTLRALRHSDGSLARFHGGGKGLEGRLDHALAASGVRTPPGQGLAMGFSRLSAGRTSVIVDVAAPAHGAGEVNAHASTLAIEVTSGRRPLLVSCGSGAPFGAKWSRVGRATGSHSVLDIKGLSSSRFGERTWRNGGTRNVLTDVPKDVRMRQHGDEGGTGLIAGHDGYSAAFGLTHVRSIDLSVDGRSIAGDDTLATITPEDNKRFDKALDEAKLQGIPFQIHFHLHPDVDPNLDLGGAAISLVQKSGEIWVFRHDGASTLSLEPSVYLEKGRLKPRATKQIVLTAKALEYATRIRWTLAKAQDTPAHVRDLERDDSAYVI